MRIAIDQTTDSPNPGVRSRGCFRSSIRTDGVARSMLAGAHQQGRLCFQGHLDIRQTLGRRGIERCAHDLRHDWRVTFPPIVERRLELRSRRASDHKDHQRKVAQASPHVGSDPYFPGGRSGVTRYSRSCVPTACASRASTDGQLCEGTIIESASRGSGASWHRRF